MNYLLSPNSFRCYGKLWKRIGDELSFLHVMLQIWWHLSLLNTEIDIYSFKKCIYLIIILCIGKIWLRLALGKVCLRIRKYSVLILKQILAFPLFAYIISQEELIAPLSPR